MTRVRTVFKFGIDDGLPEKVPRFGSQFKKPDKAVLWEGRWQTPPFGFWL